MRGRVARRFSVLLLLLLAAIVAFFRFWPDNVENNGAVSAPPLNASGAQTTPPAAVRTPSAIPSSPVATPNPAVPAARLLPQFRPMRIDLSAPGNVPAGETFQVMVNIDAERGIRELAFTVMYDKRVIQLVRSSAGTFVQHAGVPVQFGVDEPSDGNILVRLDVDNGLTVVGAGSVVTLEFQALKPGNSFFKMEGVSLVEEGPGTPTMPSLGERSITVD